MCLEHAECFFRGTARMVFPKLVFARGTGIEVGASDVRSSQPGEM